MSNNPTNDGAKTPEKAPVKKNEITNEVLTRINQLQGLGELRLPDNYSAENALQGAYLVLVEQTTKANGADVPVLEHCSRASIARALMKMVTQGLSVMKNQCYFIPYGNQLNFQRSYLGSLALAKRIGGVQDVKAVVIYEGDEFEYEIQTETGAKRITKHVQKIENIDNAKIRGAYAVRLMQDGTKDAEIMTIEEIRTAWMQGATKGKSPAHTNFTQEMCKKTVISRACKQAINSSDDSNLFTEDDEPITVQEEVRRQIQAEAGTEIISFEEVLYEAKAGDGAKVSSKPPVADKPADQAPTKGGAISFTESNEPGF